MYKVKLLCLLQMLYENLRGEMTVSATGAKISLRDSKFIQVVAKSVGVSCKEVRFHRKLKLHFFIIPRIQVSFPGCG